MKKTLFFTILSLLFLISANAQVEKKEKPTKEQIKANKVAFLTSQLDLSVEEAQKFWPVYNEHDKKMEEFHKERRKNMKKIKQKKEELTDDEMIAIIDNFTDNDLKVAQENKAYIDKVKKVLPIKKAVKLFEAEREFKHTLLKEYRGWHHGEHGEGGEMPGGPMCD